jgi:hypothetical protein
MSDLLTKSTAQQKSKGRFCAARIVNEVAFEYSLASEGGNFGLWMNAALQWKSNHRRAEFRRVLARSGTPVDCGCGPIP